MLPFGFHPRTSHKYKICDEEYNNETDAQTDAPIGIHNYLKHTGIIGDHSQLTGAALTTSYIPLFVSVQSLIPYIDDATTYANLVFCAAGSYIAFDDALESFNMRKI